MRFCLVRVRRPNPAAKPRATEACPPVVAAEGDEQAFLASVASLPPEQLEVGLERCAWFKQLVERQGLIEAEHRVQHEWWGG
ncbi:MAG: hypothetical protein HC853_09490 [Anaerolineae bacterium]|nr:hypothetical protein [Anaerolineae bacterium]